MRSTISSLHTHCGSICNDFTKVHVTRFLGVLLCLNLACESLTAILALKREVVYVGELMAGSRLCRQLFSLLKDGLL